MLMVLDFVATILFCTFTEVFNWKTFDLSNQTKADFFTDGHSDIVKFTMFVLVCLQTYQV